MSWIGWIEFIGAWPNGTDEEEPPDGESMRADSTMVRSDSTVITADAT